jgi:hypothetical protein
MLARFLLNTGKRKTGFSASFIGGGIQIQHGEKG